MLPRAAGSLYKWRLKKNRYVAKKARFWTSVGALNGTIEPDTNPLVHFCVGGEIMLIVGEQLVNLSFVNVYKQGWMRLAPKRP